MNPDVPTVTRMSLTTPMVALGIAGMVVSVLIAIAMLIRYRSFSAVPLGFRLVLLVLFLSSLGATIVAPSTVVVERFSSGGD